MTSGKMHSKQDLQEFLFETDQRRVRFNACDLPRGLTGQQYDERVIPNTLPPGYCLIRPAYFEREDLDLAIIHGGVKLAYAGNLSRSHEPGPCRHWRTWRHMQAVDCDVNHVKLRNQYHTRNQAGES